MNPFLQTEQTLKKIKNYLNLPSNTKILPKLTPYNDINLINTYLQTLTNKNITSILMISHLPLIEYLITELYPNETPPIFTTSTITNVTLNKNENDTFN